MLDQSGALVTVQLFLDGFRHQQCRLNGQVNVEESARHFPDGATVAVANSVAVHGPFVTQQDRWGVKSEGAFNPRVVVQRREGD